MSRSKVTNFASSAFGYVSQVSIQVAALEQLVALIFQLVEQLFQFMKKVKMIEVVCCSIVEWSLYL
jgi:hypothetical protein